MANLLSKILGAATSAARPGIGLGVEIAKKIKGRNLQPGQTLEFDQDKLNKMGLVGDVLKQNMVSQTNNPFLTQKEQDNPLTTTAKATAGAATYAVPFGKGANLLTKALLPGLATGALQAGSNTDVTPGKLAMGGISGAAGAGLIQAGGDLFSKALGKIGNAATERFPEQLMSGVFKQPLKDTRSALKTGESLGSEALKRGIKGTDESIYKSSIGKLNQFEDELQGALSKSKEVIPLADIQESVKPLIEKYSKAGNTSAVNNITNRIQALEQYNGKSIPVSVANEIKRTLYDEARGGYGQLASENVEGIKSIARSLKEGIGKKVAGVDALNKELSFHGKLADSLVDKMARSGRNNLMGLTDSVLVAGGPTGMGVAAAKNLAGSTVGKTYLANILNSAGKMGGSVSGVVSNATQNPILKQIIGQGVSRLSSQEQRPNNSNQEESVNNSLPGLGISPSGGNLNINKLNGLSNDPQNSGNNQYGSINQNASNKQTNSQLNPNSNQGVPPESNGDIVAHLTQQGVNPAMAQQFAMAIGGGSEQSSAPGQSVTGFSMDQLGQGYTKAILAGDKNSAAQIKNLYDLEAGFQKAQGGGQAKLTAGASKDLGDIQTSTDLVSNLDSVVDSFKDKMGPVKGRLSVVNPYDTDAQGFQAQMAMVAQAVGKSLEGGKMTDKDVPKYEKMLPKMTDTPEVAKRKIKNVQKMLTDRQRTLGEYYRNSSGGSDSGDVSANMDALQLLQSQGVL